jgi:alkylhydroperoxidase/carboxymuconolactone decarboxylase family protein YurZ
MPRKRKVAKKMPEVIEAAPVAVESPEILKAREDANGRITLRIKRSPDGTKLLLYFKAPVLADIVEKMATGYTNESNLDKTLKGHLEEFKVKDKEGRFYKTRPALKAVTKHLAAIGNFSWDADPPTALLANPDKLRTGFEISHTPDKPVPPETVAAFGKKLFAAAREIITNAKPFTMTWVGEVEETATGAAPPIEARF